MPPPPDPSSSYVWGESQLRDSILTPKFAFGRNTDLGIRGLGLAIAQTFVHENRLRQAASSLGAAEYCIEESIKYARKRKPFGKELSTNQGIQFPLVELATVSTLSSIVSYFTYLASNLSPSCL